jgi:hypothetical protein
MATALTVRRSKAKVWHQCLRHLSYCIMARLVKDKAVTGLDVSEEELKAKELQVCEVCVKVKQAV